MAQLEMCLPPSSFDIMEHLMSHMVDQICALGPLYLHEMWTYEYFLSHCRKSQVCRVPAALPSAQYRTFGKYNLCQVHTEKHSANLWHSASYGFAECRTNDTWRITLFAKSLLGALDTLPLCRVPRQGHSAKRVMCTSRTQNAPVVPVTIVGRYSLPSAATEHSVFNYFAECLHKGIRQTGSRAAHEPITLGGPWRPLLFAECLIYCTRQTWSRALHAPITIGGPSRPFFFAECQKWGTRQKSCSSCAFT